MSNATHLQTVLILADDLTGALDAAVAFAGDGRRITVARGLDGLTEALHGQPNILAVDTGSRDGSMEEAVTTMEAVALALPLAEVPILLQKVDSRLKGHVRAEVAALRRLSCRDHVVVAPAIPQMGRLQRGGWLSGAGIAAPLNVPDLVGGEVVIPDVDNDDALDRIVLEGNAATLWVGARGIAFALARARFGAAEICNPRLPASALFAIGSRDPITLAQIAALRTGTYEVQLMTPDAGTVAVDPGADFALAVAECIEATQPATVLLSGGRTAGEILDRLKVRTLDVIAEVAPGLPMSIATLPWGPVHIVTKSGGFGSSDLLGQIADKIASIHLSVESRSP